MAAKADLHGSGRIDQALVGRVGAPVRGALLGAEEMIDGGEDIGMRVKMQKADLLAAGQLAAAEALDDAAGDGMVAADRHRPRAAGVYVLVELGDPLDAVFIVVGPRKRHVTHIYDFRSFPGVQLKPPMRTALQRGDVAHGAGAQMLVALGGAVAGRMRHADKRDIRAGCGLVRRAEQGRHAPPVKVFHHAAIVLVTHCPALHQSTGWSLG